MIYNNGDLPRGWTTETLKIKHTSEPANPDIAKAFFRAGYIEAWGRGTTNIVKYCTQQGLPEPVFEGKWGGIAVIFIKQKGNRPWEESNDDVSNKSNEFRKDFGMISERMRKDLGKEIAFVFQLIVSNPYITIGEIAGKTGKTTRTIENYLKKLKDEKVIARKGPKLGGYWEMIFEN
jgi:ATP-dependent DNA helicase RecG